MSQRPLPAPLQASELVDRWSPPVVSSLITLKLLEGLSRLGWRAREEGWRKSVQTYFRTEASKFVLASLGLSAEPSATTEESSLHLARRLQAFLREQPVCRWCLQWERFAARRLPCLEADITLAHFDGSGSLKHLQPLLDEHAPALGALDAEARGWLCQQLVEAYEATRHLEDVDRPLRLERMLRRQVQERSWSSGSSRAEALRFTERVLRGTFLVVEQLPAGATAGERHTPPPLLHRKHPGHGLLCLHARLLPEASAVDLWWQIHHSPVDGAPMQEVLDALRAAWGSRALPLAPAPPASLPPQLCGRRNGREQVCTLDFLDFSPLLSAREQLSRELAYPLEGPVSLSGLLLWGLACQPAFADRKFVMPVDVPATPQAERTLGTLVIRPAMYFRQDRREGLVSFLRAFEARLRATQERRSAATSAMQLFAVAPPFLYEAQRRLASAAMAEGFGTVGITLLRNAEVFLPPLGDANPDGFLAFGRFTRDAEGSGRAGAIGIKGTAAQVEAYRQALRDMLSHFHEYLGAAPP
ncbi:hypothetical protein [Hyalangium sp.]|uniref:hypothetical protein n=1 Tax=Hyalangium sp. TaxID=2028555 RepID=UPI002D6E9323|nr:hypothetical protein [Hyalangium sp.]HYI02728.1 hypothetical protein [Hyalangium sp.]